MLRLRTEALESCDRALAYFEENTAAGFKAAVKELARAMELSVKDKLVSVDLDPTAPALVYSDLKISIDRGSGHYILSPKSTDRTVSLQQAEERLAWLGCELPGKDRQALSALRRMRNAIEHFAIEHPEAELRRVYLAALGYYRTFLKQELGLDLLSMIDADRWTRLSLGNAEFRLQASRTAKEIYDELREAEVTICRGSECCRCRSEYVVEDLRHDPAVYSCAVCGYRNNLIACVACEEYFLEGELWNAGAGPDDLVCKDCFDAGLQSS